MKLGMVIKDNKCFTVGIILDLLVEGFGH